MISRYSSLEEEAFEKSEADEGYDSEGEKTYSGSGTEKTAGNSSNNSQRKIKKTRRTGRKLTQSQLSSLYRTFVHKYLPQKTKPDIPSDQKINIRDIADEIGLSKSCVSSNFKKMEKDPFFITKKISELRARLNTNASKYKPKYYPLSKEFPVT